MCSNIIYNNINFCLYYFVKYNFYTLESLESKEAFSRKSIFKSSFERIISSLLCSIKLSFEFFLSSYLSLIKQEFFRKTL
jgi:hypothetical protein